MLIYPLRRFTVVKKYPHEYMDTSVLNGYSVCVSLDILGEMQIIHTDNNDILLLHAYYACAS